MGKTARNEQRKLAASMLNAVGAGVLSATIIAAGARVLPAQGWFAMLAALAIVAVLHLLARAVLRNIEE